MQMRVGFRLETGLVDLNGRSQSGGERAVSTIMYLMAMQDLTSAPFRVVDGELSTHPCRNIVDRMCICVDLMYR
jgi:hypothetical protein